MQSSSRLLQQQWKMLFDIFSSLLSSLHTKASRASLHWITGFRPLHTLGHLIAVCDHVRQVCRFDPKCISQLFTQWLIVILQKILDFFLAVPENTLAHFHVTTTTPPCAAAVFDALHPHTAGQKVSCWMGKL